MPGTFSQIYIQIVFAVKVRNCLIHKDWEERLYQYINGIIRGKGQKMLSINGMPDHVHLFIGMKPSCCLSDLVREIKKASNEFIAKINYRNSNLAGRKDLVPFHTAIRRLIRLLNMF